MFADYRIGPFTIMERLGTGGMASVYAASCRRMDLPAEVAIKVLHPNVVQIPLALSLFHDEAQIGARIRHPNVRRVFESGENGGLHYMVLERLRGLTLRDMWYYTSPSLPGWKPIDRAAIICDLMAGACAGLHAAHELAGSDGQPMGIVHHDVSPENLFLSWDGTLRVLDFGLARGSRDDQQDRPWGGRYAYLAPEVVRRTPADRRADVFAVGVVAWELITGRRLFACSTPIDTVCAVLSGDVPAPSSIVGPLPDGVDQVIGRALSLRPEDRFATAAGFEHALRRCASSAPRPPTRAGAARLAAQLSQSHPGGAPMTTRTQSLSLEDILEVVWLPACPALRRIPPPFPRPTGLRQLNSQPQH